MAEIYLDPWFLSIPALPAQRQVVEAYVTDLVNLHAIVSEEELLIVVSSEVEGFLAQENRYPLADIPPDVDGWPERRDVHRIFGGIMSRIGHIEEEDNVAAVLVSNVQRNPDPFPPTSSALCRGHIDELLMRLVIHSNRGKGRNAPSLLSRIDIQRSQINVQGRLNDWDVCMRRADYVPPVNVEGNVIVFSEIESLPLVIDPMDIWLDGRFEVAVLLAVNSSLAGTGKVWPIHRVRWTFGNHFEGSIAGLEFDRRRDRATRLIAAMVDSIIGRNLRQVHDIRESESGNSPTLVRTADQAKAYRRDIDHEYHLHYWQTSGGPEFSRVVPHADVRIL